MEIIKASAPAKCIITGEHSVVYGAPALVIALDMRAYAQVEFNDKKQIYIHTKQFDKDIRLPLETNKIESINEIFKPIFISAIKTMNAINEKTGLKITINSDIPPSSGLGSSAAVSVATIEAVSGFFNKKLSDKDIIEISLKSEKIVHGTPSGIDNAISVNGGGIIYEKGVITQIKNLREIPLIIGDTLVKRNTGVLVRKVRENYNKHPKIFQKIIETIGQLTLEARESFENYQLEKLGELMNINQELLVIMGVSTDSLEKLIRISKEAGAYGAKLTGAGGGGCMVAVSEQSKRNFIAEKINQIGGKAYLTKMTSEGVRFE
jgi:mevalonate kinase